MKLATIPVINPTSKYLRSPEKRVVWLVEVVDSVSGVFSTVSFVFFSICLGLSPVCLRKILECSKRTGLLLICLAFTSSSRILDAEIGSPVAFNISP